MQIKACECCDICRNTILTSGILPSASAAVTVADAPSDQSGVMLCKKTVDVICLYNRIRIIHMMRPFTDQNRD